MSITNRAASGEKRKSKAPTAPSFDDTKTSITGSGNKGKGHAITTDKDSSKHHQGGGDRRSSGEKRKQKAPGHRSEVWGCDDFR
jgi:hypothetical protein